MIWELLNAVRRNASYVFLLLLLFQTIQSGELFFYSYFVFYALRLDLNPIFENSGFLQNNITVGFAFFSTHQE